MPEATATEAPIDAVVKGQNALNFKVLTDAQVQLSTLASANAVQNQQAMNTLGLTLLSRAVETQHATDVPEGLGISAAQRGDLSKILAELGAALGSIQQMVKAAVTTPPVTSP